MSPERVLAALESGVMISMSAGRTALERRAIAEFVSGKSFGRPLVTKPLPQSMCSGDSGDFAGPLAGPAWNGWAVNTFNTRLQDGTAAGFTAAQVPRLKLKWAFGFPGDLAADAQPTVVGGRVFVGSQSGNVRSTAQAAASTGILPLTRACAPLSSSVVSTLDPNPATWRSSATALATYAVDAARGTRIWKARVDDHPAARVTGSPVFHNGRLRPRSRPVKKRPAPLPTTNAAAFAAASSRLTAQPEPRSGKRTRSRSGHSRRRRTRSARKCGDHREHPSGRALSSTSSATPCT
jgi:polyvinyl alcohol dehydrogenase (cytochrome)